MRALAEKHWPVDGAAALDEAVVSEVYATYLKRPARSRDTSSLLVALELSGYLERYLWPHLVEPASASWDHIMSIVALVNVKAREGAPPWAAFRSEPERFGAFFARVIDLPRDAPQEWARAGYDAAAAWTTFYVNAFAALEDAMVRAQALRLVSLPMWSTLAPAHLQAQLAAQPQLARPWKVLQKRKAKEAKMDAPPASSRHEREFVPQLLKDFLRALAVAGGEDAPADGAEEEEEEEEEEVDVQILVTLASQESSHSGSPSFRRKRHKT